jgi:cytochrome c-type biogenesis protein CcmH/NrfG
MAVSNVCDHCGGTLEPGDRFCPSCGHAAGAGSPSSARCPLCGHENTPGDAVCASCGADLPGKKPKSSPAAKPQGRKSPPLKMLQSWKVTAVLAVALVVTLIILRGTKSEETPKGLTPESTAMVKEIENLQKVVDQDPNNADALLKLANLYYDVQIFPRAVVMYDRYLQFNPGNADARVDMGVSYFQLALADSANSKEYYAHAQQEIKKAIESNPKHQLAYFNLGMISLHMGNLEEANGWFKQCVAIDPTTETGKRAEQLVHQHTTKTPS